MTEQGWVGSDFQLVTGEGGVALCGACRKLGRCRLGVGSEVLQSDGSVVYEIVCGIENEGGPQVAHGGWTASVFDEMVGHLPILNGRMSVTGQLSVTYVKPVPIDRPLLGRVWSERIEGHRWYVAGEMTLASTGAVLARGSAVMVLRDKTHFARHRAWMAAQDAEAPGPDTIPERS